MSESKEKNIIQAQKVLGEELLMLAVPLVLSVKFYGVRALGVAAVSVLTALFVDFLGSMIISREYYSSDFSALCTGVMIALMMPVGIPLYIPACAAAFGMLVAKLPFGGGVKTPFVPSAAGFAFAAVCFKDSVFAYTGTSDSMTGTSIGSMLMAGKALKLNSVNVLDILCGNIVGPMGTGCLLLMIACCCFIFIRRRNALISTASFVVACAVFAAIFPRTNAGIFTNIFLELSSGSLMFAAVFLLTDYSTIPRRNINKAVYGIFCGIICMVMRKMSVYEEPVCFAVLLVNAFSPLLEQFTDRLVIVTSGKRKEREDK